MSSLELARTYFDAWNAHDADALVATFAEFGAYRDPTTNGPLTGAAIGAYAKGLWDAFPDLSFELGSHDEMQGGKVVAEWTMNGTNTGAFAGLPPTGRAVSVPGLDIVETGPGGITSVTGYFDSRAVPEQLGLDVIVQPRAVGPFEFGTAVAVQSGNAAKPGAFSITTIWNDADQIVDIREASRATAQQMLEMKGFIGLVLARVGERGITVSAWETPEDVRQIRSSTAHREAMSRFWKELGDAAFTSVWAPDRINPLWVRCAACSKMVDYDKNAGRCDCGSGLPDAPTYF